MSKKTFASLMAGVAMTIAGASAAAAEELTIFWAEWDPANYLQELVNIYSKETGVKVTVETTPWSDFQTKTFREFVAKGSTYDMVVGDSQWVGADMAHPHRAKTNNQNANLLHHRPLLSMIIYRADF
jgi:multiple sugar transport system substrate-binding protein